MNKNIYEMQEKEKNKLEEKYENVSFYSIDKENTVLTILIK